MQERGEGEGGQPLREEDAGVACRGGDIGEAGKEGRGEAEKA